MTGPVVGLMSGVMWHPFSPRVEDVRGADFRALANVCRWGGHCKVWMSVAEHCVRVHDLVKQWNMTAAPEYHKHGLSVPAESNRMVELQALTHDLHEIVPPGDVPGPLLRGDDPWAKMLREMESAAANAFRKAIGVPPMLDPSVHLADLVLLATEARDLMPTFKCVVCHGFGSNGLNVNPCISPVLSCVRCGGTGDHFAGLPKPLENPIEPWPAEVAWAKWKARYDALGGRWP